MYYQRPTRGSGLAQLLGGVMTGLAQRHQNRLQERAVERQRKAQEEREGKAERKEQQTSQVNLLEPFKAQYPESAKAIAEAQLGIASGQATLGPESQAAVAPPANGVGPWRPRQYSLAELLKGKTTQQMTEDREDAVSPPTEPNPGAASPNPGAPSPTPGGQGMAPGGEGKQSGTLAVPGLPARFAAQSPDPQWRSRQQNSVGLQPFGNLGPAGPGGGQLVLARYLAANPGGGGVVGAPGFGPSPRGPLAGSPGMRIRPGAGNRSPASPERVQKLVATWEDLHGQAATAAIRSQIADYVRTA